MCLVAEKKKTMGLKYIFFWFRHLVESIVNGSHIKSVHIRYSIDYRRYLIGLFFIVNMNLRTVDQ